MKETTLSMALVVRVASVVAAISGLVACTDDPSPSLNPVGDGVLFLEPGGGEGRIRYELLDATDAVKVTASSDADWIAQFDCDTPGTVAFSYGENTDGSNRTATITVSCATASFTVLAMQDPTIFYVDNFEAAMLTGFYYGERYSPGMGEYWFFFTDKGFDEEMRARPDGTFYRVDLYAPLTDATADIPIPEGTYRLDNSEEPSCEAFTFSKAMSLYYTTASTGEMADMQPFESGTLTVAATTDGYRLELIVTTPEGVRRAVYEGRVALKNESSSGGGGGGGSAGEFPALEADVQASFDRIYPSFLGSYNGISEVNVQFSNLERDADGNNIPPGEMLDVHFFTVLNEENELAEGTYRLGRGEAGLFRKGDALDIGVWAIFGTYFTVYDEEGNKTYGLISDGTIDIVRNADAFDVTFDLQIKGGYKFTGSYSGTLDIGAVASSAITTLTDDYELDFTQGEIVTTANYWGDFYETGTGNWTIDISRAPGSRQDDTFITDICCPATGFTDDFSGVYTASHNNEASTFIPGYVSGVNIMGTMYLGGFDQNGYVTKLAPAMKGRVEITANEDGTHTIAFDCYDDAETPHNFRGSWTGPIRKVDQTVKGQSFPSARSAGSRPLRIAQDAQPRPEPLYIHAVPSVRHTCERRHQ